MRVAIIGGGIIGSLTAWMLKRRGAVPVVLERGKLGSEASWAGAGILCPINPWLYPDTFTHLIDASLALYPGLQAELEDVSGMSIERLQNGLLVPFFDNDKANHWQSALNWSKRFDWQVEELDAVSAHEAEPELSASTCSALLWPNVGQLRNPRLLQSVRKALEIEAIEVREKTSVTGLCLHDGGVTGIRLSDGSEIRVDAAMLSAGSWSGKLADQMGFSLPVEPVKGQIVLLKSEPGRISHIIKHDWAYFVPRKDGRILVGASMENVGFQRGNTDNVTSDLMRAMHDIVPGLKDAEVEHQWMGFRPGSPDGLPFMGQVPEIPGLWVASGHYRNGVALAPITATVMSGWIMGQEPEIDMSAFRPDRDTLNLKLLGYPPRD